MPYWDLSFTNMTGGVGGFFFSDRDCGWAGGGG